MISRENILKLEKRKVIYNYVQNNQGMHIREISRRTNIPRATVRHHIKYLLKQDLIIEKNDGGYNRVYATKEIGTKEKELLNLLRQEIPCKIFLHLLFSFTCSQIELSRELELTPTRITYHLKKMIDFGIIEKAPVKNGKIYPLQNSKKMIKHEPVGREIFYRRKNQEIINIAYKLIITNKNNLPNTKFVDAYLDFLDELKNNQSSEKSIELNTFDKAVDSIANLFYNFFPNPICA